MHALKKMLNFPFKFTVLIICLSWVLGTEFFPFSRFPMYDSFSKKPFVILITDENDRQLAFYRDFNVISSEIKKSYSKKLKATKAHLKKKFPKKFAKLRELDIPISYKEKIGKEVINEIRNRSKTDSYKKFPTIKLYEVQISLTKKGVHKNKVFITTG